eukprot:gene13547-19417_t
MAEILSTSKKAPAAYNPQPKPHVKNREDHEQWQRNEKKNAQIASTLKEIARAPPSSYHAPKGYESIRHGAQIEKERGKPKEGMPGTNAHVDVPPWPPLPPDHKGAIRTKANREVDIENARIQKKLTEVYSTYRREKSSIQTRVDCTDRWQMRTAMYSPSRPILGSLSNPRARPASAPRGSSSTIPTSRPASANRGGSRPASASQGPSRPSSSGPPRSSSVTRIPKTMAMAQCAGCGAKAFRKADGVNLMPCKHCKSVFYCSETCANVDWKSHKQLCKYHTTGQWQSCRLRPADEYWVNNGAMAKARRVLEHKATKGVQLTREEQMEEEAQIKRVLESMREKELAAEKKQADVERLAYYGMDGPRPCMTENGKPV